MQCLRDLWDKSKDLVMTTGNKFWKELFIVYYIWSLEDIPWVQKSSSVLTKELLVTHSQVWKPMACAGLVWSHSLCSFSSCREYPLLARGLLLKSFNLSSRLTKTTQSFLIKFSQSLCFPLTPSANVNYRFSILSNLNVACLYLWPFWVMMFW